MEAHGYRGDAVTGGGVAEAAQGVDVVVDCVNVVTLSGRRAAAMFVQGTRRLLEAEHATGVRHHVLLSVVGIDAIRYPYYQAKLRQEQAVAAGPVPHTVLRATPFHEFVASAVRRGRFGPFIVVPRLRTAPVAAGEVASALADTAAGPPAGRAPDLGGPRPEDLVDLTRRLVRARDLRGVVVPVVWPGDAGRAMRDGASPIAGTPPGPLRCLASRRIHRGW